MKIILLGPPGSGKGTMAEKLCADYSLYHMSAGELLRDEVKKGTELGEKLQVIIDSGNLVPPNLIAQMVRLVIEGRKDFLLDGFPRSVEQAKMISDIRVDKIVLLDVSKELIIERLKGRRICTKGIHGYHLINLPPKKEGICDVDGTPLIKRQDDEPTVIAKRFEVYESVTKPVAQYYAKKNKLITVDGTGTLNQVYDKMLRAMGLPLLVVEAKIKR